MKKLLTTTAIVAATFTAANAQALDSFGHPVPPTPTPTIPVCYAVSDDGFVNVRQWPNGPIMGPVPVGTQFQVIKTWYDLASRTNWSEVQTPWLASRGLTGVVASYLIDCQNG
jgi:hypothetical protein